MPSYFILLFRRGAAVFRGGSQGDPDVPDVPIDPPLEQSGFTSGFSAGYR